MRLLSGPHLAAVAAALLFSTTLPQGFESPERFGLYYSGPPCAEGHIDRTYSQFQVNLGTRAELVRGTLSSGSGGEAVLILDTDRIVRLLSNASRADWLLSYPFLGEEDGVWARPILLPDCSVAEGTLYVEALFPLILLQGPIDPRLDLMDRPDAEPLQEAVRSYRRALSNGEEDDWEADELPDTRRGAVARLERELFSPESSRAAEPWRVRLLGSDEVLDDSTSVEILLSGSDGSTGMFGHIAVGGGGQVYNVYPKGSERGAPEPVPLWDYLFNGQRGQALRRPTWVLRLEGLPEEVASSFHRDMQDQIHDIREGRMLYHPTANNCTSVSLRALSHLGIEVPSARYFTRRFPRPAFMHVLSRLPRLVASGRLKVQRVELSFIPQVPVRISEGGAPNRPLLDGARID